MSVVELGREFAALRRDDQAEHCSDDFGHMQTQSPGVVLAPKNSGDVAAILKAATAAGVPVHVRGAGHALSGHTLTPGVVMLTEGLDGAQVHEDHSVTFGAGLPWRRAFGLMPFPQRLPMIMTDNPGQRTTIGGTLGVGGYGFPSSRFGALTQNVDALEIVTGRGDILQASPEENASLFHHVLGGLGQVGVMTKARLRTKPGHATYALHAAPVGKRDMFALWEELMALPDTYGVMGTHAMFDLEPGNLKSQEFNIHVVEPWRPLAMSKGALKVLRGLPVKTTRLTAFALAADLTPLSLPQWTAAHPWFDAAIPRANYMEWHARLSEKVVTTTLPSGLPMAQCVFATSLMMGISTQARPTPFSLALEQDRAAGHPFTVATGLTFQVPRGLPDDLAAARDIVDELQALAFSLGGKRYLYGLFRLDGRAAWDRQWGAETMSTWRALRELHDPHSVLGATTVPVLHGSV